ncbi:hypothetical protein [Azospirillum argentinense]|uniref:hypothetical protein n=1 Tax=Azospirillum argentinense TaxID=2970906 RepID=UPI0032DF3A4C
MKDDKPYWVLIVLFIIMLVPSVFVAGLIFGMNFSGIVSLSADSLSSWVGAISTLAIAVLTFILAKETWYLRIAQMNQVDEIRRESIRPSVDLYLLSSPASIQLMNVHVENNGKGLAREVSFKFKPEGKSEFSKSELHVVNSLLKINMLANGIASLGSGKQRKSFVFSFLDAKEINSNNIFDVIIKVIITYKDMDGRSYSFDSVLDFSEYKGISEVGDGDPSYQIYREIKKIREIIEGAKGGMISSRLNVNLFTSEDRQNEMREMENVFNKISQNVE